MRNGVGDAAVLPSHGDQLAGQKGSGRPLQTRVAVAGASAATVGHGPSVLEGRQCRANQPRVLTMTIIVPRTANTPSLHVVEDVGKVSTCSVVSVVNQLRERE